MRKRTTLKGFHAAFWCRRCTVGEADHMCIRCGCSYCIHAFHDKDPFCIGCHKSVFGRKKRRAKR